MSGDARARVELLLRLIHGAPGAPAPRTLVVAAHPDDETIGAGVILSRLPSAVVVHVTDGAPRDERLVPPTERGSRERYARTRRAEALCSLGLAGIPEAHVRCLGFVDQEASLALVRLAEELVDLFADVRPELVLTHPYEGGHPDHDATAFGVHAAAALAGRFSRLEVAEMTSYHARNGGLATSEFLDDGVGVETLVLSDDQRELKRRMFACYASQREILAPFAMACERVRLAPAYDFAAPPQPGTLHYERLGWPMTGERWRGLARAAQAELGLASRRCL